MQTRRPRAVCSDVAHHQSHEYVPLDQLTGLMERLDIQATMMIGHRNLLLQRGTEKLQYLVCPVLSAPFSSLEEARRSFDLLWTYAVRLLCARTSQISGEAYSIRRGQVLCALDDWKRALEELLQKQNHSYGDDEMRSARQLQLQCIALFVNMDVDIPTTNRDDCHWDKYHPQLQQIVELATLVTEPQTDEASSSGKRWTFALDTSIVIPLYIVASRSRDPILRRRAIRLLGMSKRQEGMWNSGMVVRVLERIVAIEEEDMDETGRVPGWGRVTDVQVNLNPDGKRALIKYMKRRRHTDEERDVFQEWV